MKAVGYIRVSDASQVEGYSLSAQQRIFEEYCESRDWTLAAIYREEGVSANTDAISKRPEFKRLLDDVRNGVADVVVVHTLDRWARNLRVMLESLGILGQHNVGFVSISENLDYTTPHGRLTTQMLGGIAEFFSGQLSVHTKKGIDERARQGRHLGSLPFGYQSCWTHDNGEKILHCQPEHPGGVHVHPKEGPAVSKLFTDYATGTTTLSTLATWLNDEDFRTRNTKKLPNADGDLVAEPRLFTTASVRGILHNHFHTGKVRHGEHLYPGQHEALISEEIFQTVQSATKKNSGRSSTLQSNPEREYLLKGLIRCAYCEMPMWAQTYNSGNRYYREHKGSRGAGNCVNKSGSIRCDVPDEQMGQIMNAVVLPDSWMDRLLTKIQLADEVKRVNRERKRVETRLKKLGQVYVDDDNMDYEDYKRRKKKLEANLADLVVPGVNAMSEAGRLLENLPDLWSKANLGESHKLLTSMLEAVYVDCKEEKRIVGIKANSAFKPLFQIAETVEDSGISLLKSEKNGKASKTDSDATDTDSCSWWRRGRVERYREHGIDVLLAAA
ncbi:MAG: recombinase family protein [Chloroflexi bacterium]|nr:recombinase family protein [Chloroflexota bacterium]